MLTKINVFTHVVFLIIAYYTSPVFGIPGFSSCHYLGISQKCRTDDVPVVNLPETCSALFFDGIIVDKNNNAIVFDGAEELILMFRDKEESTTSQSYIYSLTILNKPLYLLYSHTKWETEIVDCKKHHDEAASLKALNMPIAGIIFSNIDYNATATHGFSNNLAALIDSIHEVLPNIEVGLLVSATLVVEQKPWLDFPIIYKKVDFFVVEFDDFNVCSDAYHNGTVPLHGCGNTLTDLKDKLSSYGITDNKKVILQFLGQPIGQNCDIFRCDIFYSKYCVNSMVGIQWCLDTDASYYAKGKFVQQYGFLGFVLKYIDSIGDLKLCCCPDSPDFPAYQFIFDGYNNKLSSPCPKFDGQAC